MCAVSVSLKTNMARSRSSLVFCMPLSVADKITGFALAGLGKFVNGIAGY